MAAPPCFEVELSWEKMYERGAEGGGSSGQDRPDEDGGGGGDCIVREIIEVDMEVVVMEGGVAA